jgi:hypothetical protein
MPIRLPDDRELALKVIDIRQQTRERTLQLGWLGRLTGDVQNKTGNIVVLVIILCFSLTVLVLFLHDSELPRKDLILSIFSIVTLVLGYYFGKKED